MGLIKTWLKSKLFSIPTYGNQGRVVGLIVFGLLVLFVGGLMGPLKCSTSKKAPVEAVASAAGASEVSWDGGSKPISKIEMALAEQKAQVLAKEVSIQDKHLNIHKKRVEDLDQTVAQIRWQLIEARLMDLQHKAEEKDWGRIPPKRGTRDWDLYREWQFIRGNINVLKEGKRPLVRQSTSAPKTIEDFQPSWVTE